MSIRFLEKSSISSPSTICHAPSTERTGKELTSPSGTPYAPVEGSATDVQSSAGVPSTQSCT